MTANRPHRGTILVEDAEVLGQEAWPGAQHVLRLRSPAIARRAEPGSFVHLRCADDLPMRRPLSIQRADGESGLVEILYKVLGPGLAALARAVPGMRLSLMGPIGRGFTPIAGRRRSLLIGGGVGMPPVLFLAERLVAVKGAAVVPLVLLGSEVPFPFHPRPSTLPVPGMPAGVIASMPLLEDAGVPSRLASQAGFPGCYPGYVTDLAAAWLGSLPGSALAEVAIYACGPTPMLAAVARVAARFKVPAQVSLEEFMACAVGGCAGCAVRVVTRDGIAMKRVCVDGPVFDAATVFPPAA